MFEMQEIKLFQKKNLSQLKKILIMNISLCMMMFMNMQNQKIDRI